MVLSNLKIVFDNDIGVYYCGQEVRGSVCFDLDQQIIMQCLNVTMEGKAEVQWVRVYPVDVYNEDGQRSNGTARELCHDQQQYFKDKHTILGGEEYRYLPEGQYKYPFCYLLPTNIPCSFEGNFGHIRYTVEADIVGSQIQNNKVQAPFSVIRPLDLNIDGRLREPVEDEAQGTFGFLCCRSGPVSVNVSVPVGGVVPGETLMPTIHIANSSRAQLSVKLAFIQLIDHYASGYSASEKLIVAKKFVGKVAARESITWSKIESFMIPPLPPSNFLFCKLIDVKYFLRIKCKRSAGNFKLLDVRLPIVVGTIPLRQHFPSIASTSSQNEPSTVIGWNLVPPSLDSQISSHYADLPPPTYQEALLSISKSTAETVVAPDTLNKNSFIPRYPVYT